MDIGYTLNTKSLKIIHGKECQRGESKLWTIFVAPTPPGLFPGKSICFFWLPTDSPLTFDWPLLPSSDSQLIPYCILTTSAYNLLASSDSQLTLYLPLLTLRRNAKYCALKAMKLLIKIYKKNWFWQPGYNQGAPPPQDIVQCFLTTNLAFLIGN